jgi:acetyltransferase-like isoleucine patch superfamily enzyme
MGIFNLMEKSFYSEEELPLLGLGGYGKNVLISRRAQIYSPDKLHLGDHVRIDDFCVISSSGGVDIGDYVHIAPFCGLYGGAGIHMMDFSALSSRVALYSVSDDFSGLSLVGPTVPNQYRLGLKSGKITLDKFVVAGTGATIMPGVTAEIGSAIGAHSLVTESCDEWSIYYGNPAKKVCPRNKQLLNLEKTIKSESDD